MYILSTSWKIEFYLTKKNFWKWFNLIKHLNFLLKELLLSPHLVTISSVIKCQFFFFVLALQHPWFNLYTYQNIFISYLSEIMNHIIINFHALFSCGKVVYNLNKCPIVLNVQCTVYIVNYTLHIVLMYFIVKLRSREREIVWLIDQMIDWF